MIEAVKDLLNDEIKQIEHLEIKMKEYIPEGGGLAKTDDLEELKELLNLFNKMEEHITYMKFFMELITEDPSWHLNKTLRAVHELLGRYCEAFDEFTVKGVVTADVKHQNNSHCQFSFDDRDSEEDVIERIQLLIDRIYMLNPKLNYDLRPHIYLKLNVDETEAEIQHSPSPDWEKYYNIHDNQRQLSLSNSQMHDEIEALQNLYSDLQIEFELQTVRNKQICERLVKLEGHK